MPKYRWVYEQCAASPEDFVNNMVMYGMDYASRNVVELPCEHEACPSGYNHEEEEE